MESSDDEYFSCDEDFSETSSLSWTIDWPKSNKIALKQRTSIIKETSHDSICNIIAKKKVLDTRRLYCISRPQYKFSCGISSVVSAFNFLYSNLGAGTLCPITHEEALNNLGFQPPFDHIRFGPFTGNLTLIRWFKKLCLIYGVKGEACIMYKPVGNGKTDKTSECALQELKNGLLTDSKAYIYHCYNHYFSPIGFEIDSENPELAYCSLEDEDCPNTPTWIFIGDTSKKFCPIHCIKWSDIIIDLKSTGPERLNVRKLYEGMKIQKQPQSKDVSTQTSNTTSSPNEEIEVSNSTISHSDKHIFQGEENASGGSSSITSNDNTINDLDHIQPDSSIMNCKNDYRNRTPLRRKIKVSNLHCIIEFRRL